MNSAVSIRHLYKAFPRDGSVFRRLSRNAPVRQALSDLVLEIAPGEILGLLGPNGAGKTTLLEILSTLLLPSSGEASICGHDVVREAEVVRAMVGYCSSVAESFYPRLTAAQNLEFFALINDLTAAQARNRISEIIGLVGLSDAVSKPFQKLSQGMKQRLALARALIADPPVLLLDEPSKSLDPLLQQEIWRFLRGVLIERMGKTILLVTHSLAEVNALCDRVAILNEGRLICVGRVAEVVESLGTHDLASAFEQATAGRA